MRSNTIFISYRRIPCVEFARTIHYALAKFKIESFFDYTSSRDGHFNKNIFNAIDECEYVFLIMMDGSLDNMAKNPNDWVRKELEYAIERNKIIIPIVKNGHLRNWPNILPEKLEILRTLQISKIDDEELFEVSLEDVLKNRTNLLTQTKQNQNSNNENNQTYSLDIFSGIGSHNDEASYRNFEDSKVKNSKFRLKDIFSTINNKRKLKYLKVKNNLTHLFLFFGYNDETEFLIKDITTQDSKSLCIIIDDIKHNISLSKNCYFALTTKQPYDISQDESNVDVFKGLGISYLIKIIKSLDRHDNLQLHLLFTEYDETKNIRNVFSILKDVTITQLSDRSWYKCIYCCGKDNEKNTIVKYEANRLGINCRMIDYSQEIIKLLQQKSIYAPVNVVSLSRDNIATVCSPLNSLIIGFDEIGQSVFRYLYEYGTFVDSNNTDYRSSFNCTVIDKNIISIQGKFLEEIPAVAANITNGVIGMDFLPIDYNSCEFADNIITERFLYTLNYAVIAIKNTDEAIAIAKRILDYVLRIRSDISNLRIIILCKSFRDYMYVKKVTDFMNHITNASSTPIMHVFGCLSEIFSFKNIIQNKTQKLAKTFENKIDVLNNEYGYINRSFFKEKNLKLEDIRKSLMFEKESISQALHSYTKLKILKESLKKNDDMKTFYKKYFHSDGNVNMIGSRSEIKYPKLSDEENKIILHLAILVSIN